MADASPALIAAEEQAVEDQTERRKRLFRLLGLAILVIAALIAIWYFFFKAGLVETDNAYVGADVAQVTPLIAAPVAEVRVSGTQFVKKGDVLVVLDNADALVDVASAEAAVRQAEQRYNQANAQVGAARAKVVARGTEISQARASLTQANANFEKARVELARRRALASSGAVSGEELSSAVAAFETARAARDMAQSGIANAQATQGSAQGDLNASEAMVAGTTIATAPDVAAARAKLQKARLDLSRTMIRAPIDGVITNRQVQVGQRVAAGTPIMTIVPTTTAYVDANFKESQFARIRIGQPAELVSDFYGDDVVYHGKVIGFAGGTGAAFAVIPAQNATGNWVKVVQRLPVRIALDPQQLREHPLRVGLSMTVTVDTRGK